jgi:hypothetical protein
LFDREMGHNSFKTMQKLIFSRIQGVFPTGESIARGFEG